ncbi:MAG TPA: acyl-ACP--UDP-N-acetylglucosamine O-acyltransferase [Polyangiaceae bacterium]|jgi:UDP-N-acetylglucosamine acyltransferase|nr:acyl-ACP--UDP-N-acetylglucosamine O-acyltransferase [Polyangiaceae bacterium]
MAEPLHSVPSLPLRAARAATVHPSAVVDPGARLADGVIVGPLCYVGADVVLGSGTELVAQATVLGPARIGEGNVVYPHVTLGAPPQDRTWSGEPTELVIGDRNVFRESSTVHRGTAKGGGTTRIGSDCLVMVGAHVAHDCDVADGVTLTNYTSLGGHVVVGRRAVIGGHVAIAPFVRVGEVSFAAGGAMIERDVPPYVIVAGDRARVRALNRVGLLRSGIPDGSRVALERAFRALYRSGEPLAVAARAAEAELGADPFVRRLLDFLAASALPRT